MSLTSAVSANTNLIPYSEYLDLPANPIDVVENLDTNQNVKKVISAKLGGELQLVSNTGVSYKLVVPANAIDHDIEFSLTLIKSITNPRLSFDGDISAVQIEPSGTYFKFPAELIIKSNAPINPEELVPFGFEEGGKDLHLEAAKKNENEVHLSLLHLTSYGIGQSMTLRETILNAANRITEYRLRSYLADMLLHKKDFPAEEFKKVALEHFEKIVRPLAENIESCKGGLSATAEYFQLKRTMQVHGYDIDFGNNNFIAVMKHKTLSLCNKEAKEACFQDHRVFEFMDYYLGVKRNDQLYGGDPVSVDLLAELDDMANKCWKFELSVKSNFYPSHFGVGASMSAEVKMKIDKIFMPEDEIESEVIVDPNSVKYTIPGASCRVENLQITNAPFNLHKFMIFASKNDQDKRILETLFYIGDQKVVFDAVCKADDTEFRLPQHLSWTGWFKSFHGSIDHETKGYDLFLIKNWVVPQNGAIIARKKYSRDGFAALHEETEFTLKHTPDPI